MGIHLREYTSIGSLAGQCAAALNKYLNIYLNKYKYILMSILWSHCLESTNMKMVKMLWTSVRMGMYDVYKDATMKVWKGCDIIYRSEITSVIQNQKCVHLEK